MTADREGLFRHSNFGALESCIRNTVTNGESGLPRLRRIHCALQIILRGLGEQVSNALSIAGEEVANLKELKLGLGELKEQSVRRAGDLLRTLEQSYEHAQKRGDDLLRRPLSLSKTAKSIFKKSVSGHDSRPAIDPLLRNSIRRPIRDALELLQGGLEEAWNQVHESLGKRLSVGIPTPRSSVPGDGYREFLLRLESMIAEKVSKRQIKRQMRRLFTEPPAPPGVSFEPSETGDLEKIAENLANVVSVDFAGVFAGAEAVLQTPFAFAKRKKILERFHADMAQSREKSLPAIGTRLRNGIDFLYGELCGSLQPLEDFGAVQRNLYEPMAARVKQLEHILGQPGADPVLAGALCLKGTHLYKRIKNQNKLSLSAIRLGRFCGSSHK